MIYFYSYKLTPRVQYICTHVFSNLLNQEISWVRSLDMLPNSKEQVVVAYTSEDCPKGVFCIRPHGMLFRKGIREQQIEMGEWQGLKTFFQTEGGDLPFDIFAASFYLLTRYEEYLAQGDQLDKAGRFKATASLAYQQDFLQLPLVDMWAMAFEKALQQHFACYTTSVSRTFSFRPVVIIDRLFKYQNTSILHNIGSLWMKLFTGKWNAMQVQLKALLHITADPFCNVSDLLQLHNRNNLLPIFFLRIEHKKWWVRPWYATKRAYRNLLAHNYMFELCATADAAVSMNRLLSQRKKLFSITRSQVTMNSYNDTKFALPQAYRNLIKASIKEDYSMAYIDSIGFRASTCTPFKYYDLEKEDYYKLLIHPIAVMDNVFLGQHAKRDELYKMMLQMAQMVSSVGGEMVSVFHNDVLSENGKWRHYVPAYESAVRAIANLEVKS